MPTVSAPSAIAETSIWPKTQASNVPTASKRKPVGIRGKIGFLPNQFIKIIAKTTNEISGASNDCKIGFIASSKSPNPPKQLNKTLRGMMRLNQSPINAPDNSTKASKKHQPSATFQ